MLGSSVYVHEEGGWKQYGGPWFVDLERAKAWVFEMLDDQAIRNGRECSVVIWETEDLFVEFERRSVIRDQSRIA